MRISNSIQFKNFIAYYLSERPKLYLWYHICLLHLKIECFNNWFLGIKYPKYLCLRGLVIIDEQIRRSFLLSFNVNKFDNEWWIFCRQIIPICFLLGKRFHITSKILFVIALICNLYFVPSSIVKSKWLILPYSLLIMLSFLSDTCVHV